MKKVFLFFVLLTFLLVLKEAKATELFSDGFETRDFSNWRSGYGSTNPTVTTEDQYEGSYSAKFSISAWSDSNCHQSIGSGYSTVYARWYQKFVNLPESGQYFRHFYLKNAGSINEILHLEIRKDSGTMNLRLGYSYPSSSQVDYTFDFQPDTWYAFEVKFVRNVNGEYRVWLDGNEVITQTGIDTSGTSNADYFHFGLPIYPNMAVTSYVDDVVIADEYIGVTGATTTSTTTTTSSTTTTSISSTTTPVGQLSVSGRLVDNKDQGIDADITIYNPSNNQEITSDDTDSAGNYGLSVVPGTYDLQYYLTNFYIPGYFIKFPSLDILSNIANIINYITWDSVNDRVTFTVDVSNDQEIQVYSEQEPISVKANGIELSKPTTLPLSENEWTYSSGEIRMIVSPATITTTTTTPAVTTTTIPSSTTTINIPPEADYYVTGSPSDYEAIRVSDGQTISSGSDAASVINDVFNTMTSGQRIDFIGDFTIDSTIIYDKKGTFDYTQANTKTSLSDFARIRKPIIILGGNWIGEGVIAEFLFDHDDASHSVIQDGYFESFRFYFAYISNAGDITWNNCTFNHVYSSPIAGAGFGYNTIRDCLFNDTGQIFFEGRCTHCQFIDCEFGYGLYHAIYLSGGLYEGEIGGYHTITGCEFHNYHGLNRGALHIKSPNNTISDNVFRDYTGWNVGISIYSQWDYSQANYNEIYNNTFTDMTQAINFGHTGVAVSPTIGNKVYNNVFTNISYNMIGSSVITIGGNATAPVEDTWIYYNTFNQFHDVVIRMTNTDVHNTVIAYNDFDEVVPQNEQTMLQSYTNTLIYGQEPYMDDYPDPLPPDLSIPPP